MATRASRSLSAQAAGPEPAGPSQWLYWCP